MTCWNAASPAKAAPTAQPAPLQQLRIYEIPRTNEGVFHDRFQGHALRIMARHGFDFRQGLFDPPNCQARGAPAKSTPAEAAAADG